MIQRIQTIWLLLASTAMVLTFKYPFYTGKKIVDTKEIDYTVNASSNTIGLILTIAFVAITAITIFLFKNRKLQLKLSLLAVLISLINFYLLYNSTTNVKGVYSLTAVLPVFVIGFAISALRCIWQDEKKIKELNSNRLR